MNIVILNSYIVKLPDGTLGAPIIPMAKDADNLEMAMDESGLKLDG